MQLISQYESIMCSFPFEEQFNHTLAINCLLGLVVMPKERILTYVPKERLTEDFKNEMGVGGSEFSPAIETLTDLIRELRHSVAHFDIRSLQGPRCARIKRYRSIHEQRSGCAIIDVTEAC